MCVGHVFLSVQNSTSLFEKKPFWPILVKQKVLHFHNRGSIPLFLFWNHSIRIRGGVTSIFAFFSSGCSDWSKKKSNLNEVHQKQKYQEYNCYLCHSFPALACQFVVLTNRMGGGTISKLPFSAPVIQPKPKIFNSPSSKGMLCQKHGCYLLHCFPPLACQTLPSQRSTGVHFTPFNSQSSCVHCFNNPQHQIE